MDNFQSLSTKQGKMAEDIAEITLASCGFTDFRRKEKLDCGVEVDLIASNQEGNDFYFEVKGSWNGSRPGLLRTDTLKKAIANGYLISLLTGRCLTILTTNAPTLTKTGREPATVQMLRVLPRTVIFDCIEFSQTSRLRWLAQASHAELYSDQRLFPDLWEMIQMRRHVGA